MTQEGATMAQSTNGNKAFAMVFWLERETKNTW